MEKKIIVLYIFKLIYKKRNGDIMILMSDPAFQGYSFEEQKETDTASVMVIKNETGVGSMRCCRSFPVIMCGMQRQGDFRRYSNTTPSFQLESRNPQASAVFSFHVIIKGSC